MTPADIKFAKRVFSLCGYEQFTNATDAVRIAGAGEYGELLAIHKENDAFSLYLRRGGRQATQLLPALQAHLSFTAYATEDAIVIRDLSQPGLHAALSQLVAALPLVLAEPKS